MTLQQTSSGTLVRRLLRVNGIVQGVGFRPFVHHLASELSLSGWVRNTDSGVEMALQGAAPQVEQFLSRLRLDGPPLARIFSVESWPAALLVDEPAGLEIRPSGLEKDTAAFPLRTLVAPDVALCPECLRECEEPTDRRYHYPFTNCTHCGPRFTIIKDLPYDRPLTALADFPFCPVCRQEYDDARDRRFHAQATACPECGPTMWFVSSKMDVPSAQPELWGDEPLDQVVDYLNNGRIVALKGLGGFHLACRADLDAAVFRLREVKGRPQKPLAVMAKDAAMAREFCRVSPAEEELLSSPEAPIVLLRPLDNDGAEKISCQVAPQNTAVGVMLPYTPLHHLLLQKAGRPLVMTSGNQLGEPLCIDNEDAWVQLRPMCDGFLFHNRPIIRRCDDSVVFVPNLAGRETVQQVRRSRGYVPIPVLLPLNAAPEEPLLAVGGDLKNVPALAAGQQVFLAQHIGDLERLSIQVEQARAIADFERLFNIQPKTIVCDMHPNYAGSRYARERAGKEGVRLIEVQHHHAHIAGCLAENDYSGPAIGLAFDGTGYGSDGRIWGGEVFMADLATFDRRYHLEYLPLPGGDAAVRRPYRTAIAYLLTLCPHLNVSALFPLVPQQEIHIIERMAAQGLNTPLTSSMGRLFDAVSALLGLCSEASHEAQAAMALEAAAWKSDATGRYYFCLEDGQIRLGRLLSQIAADHLQGSFPGAIARRFHNTIAAMAVSAAEAVRQESGQTLPVALSGGVWQNRLLLELSVPRLEAAGFEVLLHRHVPANDGGLAYGQAAAAAAQLKESVCA